jgi:PBP1b-binding outer membrane lipoprotein LpoB
MKKMLSLALMLLIAAILAGCATAQYQGERSPEMHPGHTGHEVHY